MTATTYSGPCDKVTVATRRKGEAIGLSFVGVQRKPRGSSQFELSMISVEWTAADHAEKHVVTANDELAPAKARG